jgi:DNA-directed RNA polymerase specialized sigma subunit
MAVMVDDPHFRYFARSLERAIENCGSSDEEFLERQKRQVETLIALEGEFRDTVIASAQGERIYEMFIQHICDERRNILDARPFFRERQAVFTKRISKALRKRNAKGLYPFRFNYRFVQFIMRARKWKPKSMVTKLAAQIHSVRQELITMNMPLAISRARIFYSRTQKAHLSYMDLIDIACEGLMSGIDKFVPPFSKVFRGVAIGRMTGNFIENYSETLIHFFPVDKRKIYRANKAAGRAVGGVDFAELAEKVNTNKDGEGVEAAHRTNPAEIADLMAASSTISTDTPATDDEDDQPMVDRFAAPVDTQPDVIYEQMDSMRAMSAAMAMLTPFEQKLLRLKGIRL